MRQGETIAMLLKDHAGGRRVCHISEPSRKRCFGATCGPFGVHFCRLVFTIVIPLARRCYSVHLEEFRRSLNYYFRNSGRLFYGLHFNSSGDALT